MIPPDVASALRLQVPDPVKVAAQQPQNQPLTSVQQVTDALSNLVPGQRILAEIQALMPNGTYRATVAQRDITLALPFSAKQGDTLELEVKESDGKLTLAFVTNRTEAENKASLSHESVPTSLSNTGKLIGQLMSESAGNGKQAAPVALNGSQPLVEKMPADAATLAPMLKQAITQSGMFYEAHQARWVAGELPTEALKQEPQGKLSSPAMSSTVNPENTQKTQTVSPDQNSGTAHAAKSVDIQSASTPVARELVPMVQQQLDGLANQNFTWQGQVWPGQQMHWEIGEDRNGTRSSAGEDIQRWQTRLKLSLPKLGDIDISLNLQPGGAVGLSVTADSQASETVLRNEIQQLRNQFEAAGLRLTELSVQHDKATE